MAISWPIDFRKSIYEDKSRGFTRITYGRKVHLDSPVALLLVPLAGAVARIVPERHRELLAITQNGASIRIDSVSQDFYIAAHVKEKYVNLPLAALERIWASTYFYLAVLDLLEKRGPGVEIDLTEIPEIQAARGLAIWAQSCEKKMQQTVWPENLPRPDKDDGTNPQIKRANDYFYNALCFVILHEIGHIIRKHHPSRYEDRQNSYKCEFEADAWAARFMLEKWRSSGRGETDFIGRCTGIALGLSMLAGVEFYHRAAKDDHPTIAERLLKFFDKYLPETTGPKSPIREFPMYFATAIIHGHFQNAGVPFELLKSFDDFTTYLIEAHRAMSKLKN